MLILGVSGGFGIGVQDSSAVLMRDGVILAAVAEERLSGEKFGRGRMPTHAIAEVLAQCGFTIGDVDLVATSWMTYLGFMDRVRDYFRFAFGSCPEIVQFDHHECHAASAYYASGFETSKVITYDLSGDGVSTAIWQGSGSRLTKIMDVKRPNSLGVFYSAITQYLGFSRDSDEYKVMGLAAYGQPRIDLSWLLRAGDGDYELNIGATRYSRHSETGSRDEQIFDARVFEQYLDFTPRIAGPLEAHHRDLAASAQTALESTVTGLLSAYTVEGDYLCIAGGVGLNCSLNGKLLSSGRFAEIFVQPAAGDDGIALGAAYLATRDAGSRPARMTDAFLGTGFSNAQISAYLTTVGLEFKELADPASVAASLIADGRIVGWFQGRMEFGPRALGARSILASACRASMKDDVNRKIKFREEFRPFGPSVLVEDQHELFKCPQISPYMCFAVPVTAHGAELLPATTHLDGTARLQTVGRDCAPRFHALLREYRQITGCGAVLNTSLNLAGQPLASHPADAVRAFACSGMDALILGDFIVSKPGL